MSVPRPSFLGLYENRLLSKGYPDLELLGVAYKSEHQEKASAIRPILECLKRLVDLSGEPRTVSVIGCGPKPQAIKELIDLGYDAHGIEPVVGFVEASRAFLHDSRRVSVGSAEHMPLADSSQRLVIMESVLEHVDSPAASLAEAYRVLMPGGVLFLTTTNRYAVSNGEFRRHFFQWFPAVVKESYVFRHLHYDPALADFSSRPAVHWFCYSELCSLGRNAGFARFYSLLDLVRPDAPRVRRSVPWRLLIHGIQQSPWLRGLALTLFNDSIIMLKREQPSPAPAPASVA